MKTKSKKPSYIAIEGCIGVGKTTLCQALAERMGAQSLLEQVEENPFLGDFYKDAVAHGFKTQIFFLLSRYKQHQGLHQNDLFAQKVISDYFMLKDRIFAEINLAKTELALYNQLFDALFQQLQMPDLIVYLRAPLSVVLERIKKRDRAFERNIEEAYLTRLMASYDRFFGSFTACPVLIVETEELNFPNREHDVTYVLDSIGEVLNHGKNKHLVTAGRKAQQTLF